MAHPIVTRGRNYSPPLTISLAITGALALASLGTASARPVGERHAVLLPLGSQVTSAGETFAPIGWVDFCKRYPQECVVDPKEPLQITLSPDRWEQIVALNKAVNARIRPLPDIEHWGLIESWDYPEDGSGDCEDYVLEKRKHLVARGLPRRALLITVVLDEAGAGHAVLMVRTDRGDFILDNKRDAILNASATGYTFIKLENQKKSGWLAFGGHRSNAATATLSPSN